MEKGKGGVRRGGLGCRQVEATVRVQGKHDFMGRSCEMEGLEARGQ